MAMDFKCVSWSSENSDKGRYSGFSIGALSTLSDIVEKAMFY